MMQKLKIQNEWSRSNQQKDKIFYLRYSEVRNFLKTWSFPRITIGFLKNDIFPFMLLKSNLFSFLKTWSSLLKICYLGFQSVMQVNQNAFTINETKKKKGDAEIALQINQQTRNSAKENKEITVKWNTKIYIRFLLIQCGKIDKEWKQKDGKGMKKSESEWAKRKNNETTKTKKEMQKSLYIWIEKEAEIQTRSEARWSTR